MSYYYLTSGESAHITLPINTTVQTCSFVGDTEFNCELHNHASIELVTVLRGELHMPIDKVDYTLKAGETLLVNPFALHSCTWTDSCADGEYITLILFLPGAFQQPKSVLSECGAALAEARCQFDEFYPAGHPAAEYIQTIHRLYHDKSPANEALCLANVYSLIALLLEDHYHPTEEKSSYKRDIQFLKKVTAFVRENYAKPITSADIAAALYMEMSQFCRIFRRHFGTNFSNHLCHYRVKRAAELYQNSTMPISAIAKAVGFKDYCYFSRSFKRYMGKTPAEYFRRWRSSKEENAT